LIVILTSVFGKLWCGMW